MRYAIIETLQVIVVVAFALFFGWSMTDTKPEDPTVTERIERQEK